MLLERKVYSISYKYYSRFWMKHFIIEDIEMANRAYGIGSYGPVYRSGGVVGWVVRVLNPEVGGIAMGRNLLIMAREHNVFKHETAHYYQQLLLSPTTWAARIIPEQFRPGPLEWGASMFE
jgi:hypothetical protein